MLTNRGLCVSWMVPRRLKPWNPEMVSISCIPTEQGITALLWNASYQTHIVPGDDEDRSFVQGVEPIKICEEVAHVGYHQCSHAFQVPEPRHIQEAIAALNGKQTLRGKQQQ